jgi:hypothetical protein
MNLYEFIQDNWCGGMSSGAGALCGSPHGSVRAKRSARGPVCAAVFLIVCGSAHGSVRLSGSAYSCVRQCVAVCGSVWKCALRIVMHKVAHNIY